MLHLPLQCYAVSAAWGLKEWLSQEPRAPVGPQLNACCRSLGALACLSLGVTHGACVTVSGPRWECLSQRSAADAWVPVHSPLQPKPRTRSLMVPPGCICTVGSESRNPTAGTQAPGATQEPEAPGQTVGTHIRQAQFSTHKRRLVGQ